MDEERFYRKKVYRKDYTVYEVKQGETDILVSADKNFYSNTLDFVSKYRNYLENYIKSNPDFLTSFAPLPDNPYAPPIIQDMLHAAKSVGVGPMAAVAGAIAQYVGSDLRNLSRNVIIENGGDNYMDTEKDVIISIYAGKSPLSEKIAIRITPEQMPCGVCTSSATVGHSVSFGSADAVCVVAPSAILADAAATALGNRVRTKKDIKDVLEKAMEWKDISGVLIIMGDYLGVTGDIVLE